jgi:hypothetical protein
MGWVDAGDYEEAAPDPLAEAAPGILAHMNGDHVDSMVLLARAYARMEAAEATISRVRSTETKPVPSVVALCTIQEDGIFMCTPFLLRPVAVQGMARAANVAGCR